MTLVQVSFPEILIAVYVIPVSNTTISFFNVFIVKLHSFYHQDVGVPVIAEVRGLATAAGCQLVASCDIAIASEQSKFATPGSEHIKSYTA